MALPPVVTTGRRVLFARLVGIGTAQALCAVGLVLLVRRAFDTMLVGDATSPSVGLALAVVATAALAAWLRRGERVATERLAQHYVGELRHRLLARVASRGTGRGDRAAPALLHLFGDLAALRDWAGLGVARLTVAGACSIGMLAVLTWMDPLVAAAVAAVAATGAGLQRAVAGDYRRRTAEARRARGRLAARVTRLVSALPAVHACGRGADERRRAQRASRRVAAAMVHRAGASGTVRALGDGTALLASATVLLVGMTRVADGAMSPGGVVAAMAIVGLLATPVRDLSRVHERWQAARVAAARIERSLERRPARRATRVPLPPGRGRLVLDGLHAAPLREALSIDVEAGGRALVVGGNGSGKSTLLRIVAGLQRAESGHASIDGVDLRHLGRGDRHRAVALVSGDLPLVPGTVRSNLLYGSPDTDEATLAAVAARCGLAARLDDRVTGDGRGLSAGERELLLLARGLLCAPRVLLVDGIGRSLDDLGRRRLRDLLQGFAGTVVATACTPTADWPVDRVVDLDGSAAGGPAQHRAQARSAPLALVGVPA